MGMRVERISVDEARPWILGKHYAKRMPCITDCYGAFVDRNIVGVCSFGIPASPNLCVGVCGDEYKDKVLELNRLCVDDDSDISRSAFVATCLKRLSQLYTTGKCKPNGRIIVSYADTAQGHIGKIYQATNWLYTGCTKERTDIGGDDNKHSRHYDKGCDYSLNRKLRSAKHRYVYFVGHRWWKKQALSKLKYEVIPYPKGETKRYDASTKIERQVALF